MDHIRSLRPRASGLVFGVNVSFFSALFNLLKKSLTTVLPNLILRLARGGVNPPPLKQKTDKK